MKKISKNAVETMALAKLLHAKYPKHKIWLLYGDLGSGKTTLIKGLGQALGMDGDLVKSPTYTLVNEYESLTHYDLYRIEQMDDLTLELLEEHLAENKRLVIEWPEKIESYIQKPHLKIYLKHIGEDLRSILVDAK